jgi:hypothetical protein
MPLSFPSNPIAGQTTTQNGRTYSWSGYAWEFITQNVNSARSSLTTTSNTSNLSITGGYVPGYLDLFQNGSKLLSGADYTATDGTSITLANTVPSGTTIEYITLLPSVNNNLYTKLDNISSSFNGSSTSFGLAVSGTAYYPVSANTLGIYVGGVAQEPIFAYSVSGSNIVFTEAPASGLTFWGVGYGTTAVATLNGIAPGSSGFPSISSSNDLTAGFYFPSSGNISIAGNLGIGTNSPSTNLDINSNKFRVRNSKTPSSITDTGNQGDICWDSNYIYVCINTNSWTRSPISAWSSDPYFSNVSLLLHMNGAGSSFVDSSVSPKIITAEGSATQSSTQSKWGGKSLSLNGNGSYITIPDSPSFDLSSADWVIETWVYPTSFSKFSTIISKRTNNNVANSWHLFLNKTNGYLGLYTGTSYLSSTVVSLNQWSYLAASLSSGILRLYSNGTKVGEWTGVSISNISEVIRVGWHYSSEDESFNGYIDDVRITLGSNRGYTGSTITVPTAAFPDYNT